MTILYGIKNCDSVKKARLWLKKHGLDYDFVDFRETTPKSRQLQRWSAAVGVDALINRRSTSWKQLDDVQKALFADSKKLSSAAIELLQDCPTLIKRPLLENSQHILCGFSESNYHALFNS